MEIKHNPNSLRQDASSYWSDLPLDLLNLVFERLSFANFTRAKSVCSSWYSASRRSVPKNQIPWLILFPEDDNNNNNSCKLSNPEEKHKLYKTEDLGVEFTKSVCLATHGSWLLMRDPRYDFYIVNLFTHERIDLPSLDLPSLELQLGSIKIERVFDDLFRVSNDDYQREIKGMFIRSPVIWIDEKTKDYVVLWGLWSWCVLYSKKGDTSWNMIRELSNCLHMVYKDHKLYFASFKNIFTILDFSGKIPQQTFQCATDLFRIEFGPSVRRLINCWVVNETKLVVTVAGDVLKVQRMLKPRSRKQSFRIFKIYSSLGFPKYERVRSLGNEAMLFDLGVTVLVDEVEGLKRNSIYFSGLQGRKANTIYIFNFETRKMESLQKLDCSPVQLFGARWFLPSLKHT